MLTLLYLVDWVRYARNHVNNRRKCDCPSRVETNLVHSYFVNLLNILENFIFLESSTKFIVSCNDEVMSDQPSTTYLVISWLILDRTVTSVYKILVRNCMVQNFGKIIPCI